MPYIAELTRALGGIRPTSDDPATIHRPANVQAIPKRLSCDNRSCRRIGHEYADFVCKYFQIILVQLHDLNDSIGRTRSGRTYKVCLILEFFLVLILTTIDYAEYTAERKFRNTNQNIVLLIVMINVEDFLGNDLVPIDIANVGRTGRGLLGGR